MDELERVERPPFAGFEPTDLARGTGSVSKSFIRLGIGLSGDEDGCDGSDDGEGRDAASEEGDGRNEGAEGEAKTHGRGGHVGTSDWMF